MTGRGAARRRRLLPRGYGFAVAGIAVGMAGLVALGALADRISRFIDGGHRFVLGQISVAGAGMGTGAGFTAGGLLARRTIEAIRRVPGVSLVQAQVMLPLNPGTSALFLMTAHAVVDRVVAELKSLNPELITSNLSDEQESRLRELFAEGQIAEAQTTA